MKSSKKLWFKAKSYGWGWTPVSWEGWLTVLIWILLLSGITAWLNLKFQFGWQAPVLSVLVGFVLTGILLRITYSTGEPPSWRWGRDKPKKSDSKDSKEN